MSSAKRKMPPANLLQRRVRPRFEPEPESDVEDDVSEGPSEEGAGLDEDEEERSADESGSGSDEVSPENTRGLKIQLSDHCTGRLRCGIWL